MTLEKRNIKTTLSQRNFLAVALLSVATILAFFGQLTLQSSPTGALVLFAVSVALATVVAILNGNASAKFIFPPGECLRWKKVAWLIPAVILAIASFYFVAHPQTDRWIPAALWLTAIATMLLPFWLPDRYKKATVPQHSQAGLEDGSTGTWILITLILTIAFVLRVFELERFPIAIHNDEANCGLMGQQILQEWREGRLDWFRIRDFYLFNTLGFIPSAIFQGLFPPYLYGHRLANVVWSMASLFLFYLLIRDLFGKVAGIMGLCLAATAHFSIHWSRTGIHCGHVAFLASLCMWILWKGISTGQYKWFMLLGTVLPFCAVTYGAAQVIPLTIILVVGTYWCSSHHFRQTYTIPLLFTGIAVAITSAPLIHVYMKAPYALASRSSSMVWTQDASSIKHMKSVSGDDYLTKTLIQNLKKSLLLFNKTEDRNSQYGFRLGGILDNYSASVFVVGLGVMLPRIFTFSHWPFLLFITLNILLGSVLTMDPAQYGRLAGLAFIMGVPSALWAKEFYCSACKIGGKRGKLAILALLLAFTIAVSIENILLYFVKYDANRGDHHEASINLIAHEVASHGASNKTFVLKGAFPTDFKFQSHRFIADSIPVESFVSIDEIGFPSDENIRSLTVILPLNRPELVEALSRKFPTGKHSIRHLSYRNPTDFYAVFIVKKIVQSDKQLDILPGESNS